MTDFAWLFVQIERLLDDWDIDCPKPSIDPLSTLVRFLQIHNPAVRPSIGADALGNLSASWISGGRRLTIYFCDGGLLRCSFSEQLDGQVVAGQVASGVDRLDANLPDYAVALYGGERAAA